MCLHLGFSVIWICRHDEKLIFLTSSLSLFKIHEINKEGNKIYKEITYI